jgi:hypothetical protein
MVDYVRMMSASLAAVIATIARPGRRRGIRPVAWMHLLGIIVAGRLRRAGAHGGVRFPR